MLRARMVALVLAMTACGDAGDGLGAMECRPNSVEDCNCGRGVLSYRICGADGRWPRGGECLYCDAYRRCNGSGGPTCGNCVTLSDEAGTICLPVVNAGRCPQLTTLTEFAVVTQGPAYCSLYCSASDDGRPCLEDGSLVCRRSAGSNRGVCAPR